jgi:uncharacterized protein (DUF2147 family)
MSPASPGCLARMVDVRKAAFVLLLLGLAARPALAQPAAVPPDPTGDWFTEDKKGVIHVGPCGPVYCGAIVGISSWAPDGGPPKDTEGRSECQLVIIHDMKPGDDGRRHGTVTDPQDGKTYTAELWLDETGDLRLRGYIGLPLFGSTQHWTKFAGKRQPDCHFRPA